MRADASADIGFGHVMRTMALAEQAQERGMEVRYTGQHSHGAVRAITDRGFTVTPELEDRWPADLGGDDVAVLDGYRFGPADHLAARQRGARVVAMDDLGEGRYPVDVLVHQNLAPETSFDVEDDTAVLVGPEFALVRREFRSHRRIRVKGRRLLITLGGSDTAAMSADIAAWANSHPQRWDITVLLGPEAPDIQAADVDVVRAPGDVGAVFDTADVAIAAAGATTWELCCMGIPALLIQVADNQRHIGRPVGQRGAAVFLGARPVCEARLHQGLDRMADTATRRQISQRAMQLVDGRGTERVLDAALG